MKRRIRNTLMRRRLRHNDSNCVPFHTRVVGYDIRCPISDMMSDIGYDVRYLYPTSDIISDVRYLYPTSDIYIRHHPTSGILYPTSGVCIRHPVSISDIRYLYPTSGIYIRRLIYIRRPISISNVRYRYPTSDIDIRRPI